MGRGDRAGVGRRKPGGTILKAQPKKKRAKKLTVTKVQDAVRPKGDHDAQHPGKLFDLDEIKKGSPAGQCRCIVHPVEEESQGELF